MGRKIGLVVCMVIVALWSTSIFASKGVVVYNRSCDYYIVETNMGYALLEWYGGNDPSEGDVMVGDYESYGMKEIYNVTADSEAKVWVEEFWLSKDRVVEELREHCN